MTILQLITRRQTRGAETFAIQLAEALAARGNRVIVAGLYAPSDTPPAISQNVEVIDLSESGPRAIPHFEIVRSIATLIKREAVEVVQANASDNLKYAVLSRKLFRWQAALVYRNASIMSAWVYNSIHHRLYRYLLRATDAVASVSTMSKTDIESTFELSPNMVHRLTIATPVPEIIDSAIARVRLDKLVKRRLSPGTKLIFHIGAFTWEKNHKGLLHVFKRVQEEYKGNVRLVSIGSGPLFDQIVDGCKNPDVIWLGYRTDVLKLLPAADLLLLTSHIEGTPGVVLEAGANRVVPLAYSVGAVHECFPRELVKEINFPFEDYIAMAKRAAELLENGNMRSSYANRMQEFVKSNFSISSVADQFETLYRKYTNTSTHEPH